MSQMVALFRSRRVFDFLAGTGFKEDLDDVFARIEATLKPKDFAAVRNLDRKIHDVNEATHIYKQRFEHVNAQDEQRRAARASAGRRAQPTTGWAWAGSS
jgi:hypothetical protein